VPKWWPKWEFLTVGRLMGLGNILFSGIRPKGFPIPKGLSKAFGTGFNLKGLCGPNFE